MYSKIKFQDALRPNEVDSRVIGNAKVKLNI